MAASRSWPETLFAYRCVCFVLSFLLVTACDGPEPRTAPKAGTAGTKQEETPEEPIRSARIAEVDIPTPSRELISLALSATVRLSGDGFQGSGVIVHRDEGHIYVLTVAHAVRISTPDIALFSLFSGARPADVLEDVELVSTEERADLALLKASIRPDTEVSVVKLANLSDPAFAYSSGCVGTKRPELKAEQILRADEIAIRIQGSLEKRFMWETSRPQEEGRSGGPLLNDKGFLLGIALGKSGGYGYYAHIREISKYFIDNGLAGLVTYPELLSIHQERNK